MKKNVACIDLGSNSCRMRIAQPDGQTLYKDAKATKLGEGLFESGRLTETAMNRAFYALDEFSLFMELYQVGSYRAVATAACREAENGADFVRQVHEKTGIFLEIISPLEEARLNLKGAISHAKGFEYVIVYDLGGASTEITLAKNTKQIEIIHTISIPWGARNGSEAYDLQEYDGQNALRLENDIKKYIEGFIKASDLEKYRDKCCLVAISSTPLRLCSMVKNQEKYEREQNDGEVITKKELEAVVQRVCAMNLQERQQSPYIGENRAPVFIAAAIIFKTIYDMLNFDKVIVSYKGALDAMIEELCHG